MTRHERLMGGPTRRAAVWTLAAAVVTGSGVALARAPDQSRSPSLSRLRAGRPAPAFTVTNADTGETISNKEIAGRWVLIDFWATWCGPCVAAIPYLEDAHAAFADRGFDILSISLDANEARVARFRGQRFRMPWMHAVPRGGIASAPARAFGVRGIPAYFLIAPDGTIAATGSSLHGRNLGPTLRKFLEPRGH